MEAVKTMELSEVAGLVFLKPESACFFKKDDDFLALTLGGHDKGRVSLHRALPISDPDRWICVMDTDGKELGIIADVRDFSPEQSALIERELTVRYFTPVVLRIRSAKEKMGYVYFEIELGAGRKNIAVKDVGKSIRQLDQQRILIIDVDGNRYMIQDAEKLDRVSSKLIGAYIL